MDRRRERRAARSVAVALASVLAVGGTAARAGHSIGHYPSYYPDEIRIDAVDPAAAAKGLGDGTLHAYVGATPAFDGKPPGHVKPATSLGSFLVLGFDAAFKRFDSADARCAAARSIAARLADAKAPGFVFHPYPVTPYHADYLHHADRAAAAKAWVGDGVRSAETEAKARGDLAEAVAGRDATTAADVVLETVPLADLLAAAATGFDGWLGPPWIKQGWFQAYRLLAPALIGAPRQAADDIYRRLVRDDVADLVEQTNLERRLVSLLTADCRRLVIGYAAKTEFVNDAFSSGIENIAFDSHSGLGAPIFHRTAKLKDFPWNGSLRLGVGRPAEAAWNPVAGFGDPAGALVWAALGDPAMIPYPDNASWVPNRADFEVSRTRGRSGGVRVPADAVRPAAGSGALAPIGNGTFASTKLVYNVLASPYLDGTEPEMADLVYPFAFVFRWGAKNGTGGAVHEPRLEPAFALLRDRLAGIRPVRIGRVSKSIAPGLDVIQRTPVVEIYLRDAPGDDNQVAALAPPWSTIPWHLLALMEEAVIREYAAFSKEEAERRGVAWLDIVRDKTLLAKTMALIAEFERTGFRPPALRGWVGTEDARGRWRALRKFAERNGHLLATNGPYKLKSWTSDGVVLSAVREATYPLGFGTFNRFVNPPRAVLREATREADGFAVAADVDIAIKAGRHYRIERQPLTRATAHGTQGVFVASRHLLIGPDGVVIRAGPMAWEKDNRFTIPIPNGLAPGRYTVALGVFLDGNALDLSIRLLPFDVGGR